MITAHNMWEAEMICDKAGITVGGRIVALGRPEDLRSALSRQRVVEIEVLDLVARIPRSRAPRL